MGCLLGDRAYPLAVRLAAVWVMLSLLASCASPPAFPVPQASPMRVALDVQPPLHALGTWSTIGFTQTLREELARYNIVVVRRNEEPDAVAVVDLGRFTYQSWQEIDVSLDDDRRVAELGRIRIPDLSMTTTDVAAQMVAELIAKRLWAGKPPP
jgi:hypothetical protein